MDTLLHGKIGYILGKELINNGYLGITIKSFIYGNVLPDFSPKYRMTKHEKIEDFNIVLRMIDELAYDNEKINKNISIKLGMLSHYLCDFFTFPHNEAFKKNLICHELYEQAQRILWWGKLSEVWDECSREIQIKLESKKDIVNYIEDMHSIYTRNAGDKKRDIIFSNILIRVVCSSILKIRESQKALKPIETAREFQINII
jgi:CRISPR/Cas system CSM-associated protein Csm2 small subunit